MAQNTMVANAKFDKAQETLVSMDFTYMRSVLIACGTHRERKNFIPVPMEDQKSENRRAFHTHDGMARPSPHGQHRACHVAFLALVLCLLVADLSLVISRRPSKIHSLVAAASPERREYGVPGAIETASTAVPARFETRLCGDGELEAAKILAHPEIRIYTYELPKKLPGTTRTERCPVGSNMWCQERNVHLGFKSHSTATKDPSKADLFFVPAYLVSHYFRVLGVPNATSLAGSHDRLRARPGSARAIASARAAGEAILSHIQTSYPFYNASSGANHVWALCYGLVHLLPLEVRRSKHQILLLCNGGYYRPNSVIIPASLPYPGLYAARRGNGGVPRTHRRCKFGYVGRAGPDTSECANSRFCARKWWRRRLDQLYGRYPRAQIADSHSHFSRVFKERVARWSLAWGHAAWEMDINLMGQEALKPTYVEAKVLSGCRFSICPPGTAQWTPRPALSIIYGAKPVIVGNVTLPLHRSLNWGALSVRVQHTEESLENLDAFLEDTWVRELRSLAPDDCGDAVRDLMFYDHETGKGRLIDMIVSELALLLQSRGETM